jgi:hypothetical protein
VLSEFKNCNAAPWLNHFTSLDPSDKSPTGIKAESHLSKLLILRNVTVRRKYVTYLALTALPMKNINRDESKKLVLCRQKNATRFERLWELFS